MLKKLITASSFFLVFLSATLLFSVNAADFALTKIGALDLGGKTYPEWWYTGVSPIFYGTGESGEDVSIKIGDSIYSATVSSDGTWYYNSVLDKGDYVITLSQGASSYTFTLHLGQPLPDNLTGSTTTLSASESTTGVPATGFNQVIALSFGLGIALLASYFYISGDTDKRLLFEKRVLKEDR